MTKHNVKLIDGAGKVLAVAEVADEGAQYGGTIDLEATPPAVRALFDEFDEIVNGQMFSFLDEIHDKIDALNVTAEFSDGRAARLHDLQVYPSTGDVSFKVAEFAALNGAPSPARNPQRS